MAGQSCILKLYCPDQVGQATTIYHWAFEDGTEGGPAAFEHVESSERPSEEEVQKAGPPLSLASLEALKESHDGQLYDS